MSGAPRLAVRTIMLFYAALAGVALIWAGYHHGGPVLIGEGATLGWATLAGLALAAAVVLSRPVMMRWPSMSAISEDVVGALGPRSNTEVALIALASGVGEELLFRGAMQPAWGIVPTTLVFGLLHGLPGTRQGAWGAFAVIVGFAFGLLRDWEGGLLACTLAHIVINGLNLRALLPRTTRDPS